MKNHDFRGLSNGQLLLLAVCLYALTAAFFLGTAARGYSSYRDQHLGTALEYARGHINLLKPMIVGFNANGAPTPQEPPLWQAMVAVVFKLFGTWFGWANLVSLALLATCFFPLFRVAQDYLGTRAAWWTLVFFVAQPLVFSMAGTAGTDGFSIATAIWFFYFAVRLLKQPGPGAWLAATLVGAVAATTKMPFFLAAGLACFFLAALFHRHSLKPWLVFLAWTCYTDHCMAAAEFPFVDLRVSDPQMKFWYFGDLHYRLSPGNWIKGGWRLLNACFGSFALVGLFVYALFCLRGNRAPNALLAGGVIATLVFTQLVLHHTHYYLMFSVPVAMLAGQAAADLEVKFAVHERWKSWLALGGEGLVLGLSLLQGLTGLHVVLLDGYPREIAAAVDKYTGLTDKLLIQNGGWGGEILFLAHRDGLSIWDTKLLENPQTFARLKSLGYNRLVMISESPLLAAVQKANPGQTRVTRETYRNFLTPVAKDWPTVFESEDILIKEIP